MPDKELPLAIAMADHYVTITARVTAIEMLLTAILPVVNDTDVTRAAIVALRDVVDKKRPFKSAELGQALDAIIGDAIGMLDRYDAAIKR